MGKAQQTITTTDKTIGGFYRPPAGWPEIWGLS